VPTKGDAMSQRAVLLILAATLPISAAQADPQQMDCKQMAAMPHAPMTLEQCEAMKHMATSAHSAMNDTGAARPGDATMSCDDIIAEMKTLDVRGVSAAHRQQSEAAGQNLRTEVNKQQREAAAISARENAEIQAAMAADRATELSTGGLVRGKAASTLEQRLQQENQKTGERMATEMQPRQQAAFASVTDSGNDVVQSMQSNPRFARLISLAGNRNCKEPGR
jgi:hypothetical protein